MELMHDWIMADILKNIRSLDYDIEKLPITNLSATTNNQRKVIIYNPDSVTLFEITEEYFHALKKHHRLYDYDVLNKDESEAHSLALKYLFAKWCKYVGVNDWLQFSEAMGVPSEHYETVIEMFKPLAIEQA